VELAVIEEKLESNKHMLILPVEQFKEKQYQTYVLD